MQRNNFWAFYGLLMKKFHPKVNAKNTFAVQSHDCKFANLLRSRAVR